MEIVFQRERILVGCEIVVAGGGGFIVSWRYKSPGMGSLL
jgi:hypothetical protein